MSAGVTVSAREGEGGREKDRETREREREREKDRETRERGRVSTCMTLTFLLFFSYQN